MQLNKSEYKMAFVFVWLQTPRLIKPLHESRTTGVFVHVRLQQAEWPALWVSLFETDTGELLFSGLSPNLPLMDRPPISQLV